MLTDAEIGTAQHARTLFFGFPVRHVAGQRAAARRNMYHTTPLHQQQQFTEYTLHKISIETVHPTLAPFPKICEKVALGLRSPSY